MRSGGADPVLSASPQEGYSIGTAAWIGIEERSRMMRSLTVVIVLACQGAVQEEDAQKELDKCIIDTGVLYINLLDIENGKRFSVGSQDQLAQSHTIYTNIKTGGATHLARLYVQK